MVDYRQGGRIDIMPGTARDGTEQQISSQAVECVTKVDFRYHVTVRHGIYVGLAPGGVNCSLAPTWHPNSHLDRVEVILT